MNGQRFHQQKRIEMKTEQCERSLNSSVFGLFESSIFHELLIYIDPTWSLYLAADYLHLIISDLLIICGRNNLDKCFPMDNVLIFVITNNEHVRSSKCKFQSPPANIVLVLLKGGIAGDLKFTTDS